MKSQAAHAQHIIESLLGHPDVSVDDHYLSADYDFQGEIAAWTASNRWKKAAPGAEAVASRIVEGWSLFGRVTMRWRSISDPTTGGESETPDLGTLFEIEYGGGLRLKDLLPERDAPDSDEPLFVLDCSSHAGNGVAVAITPSLSVWAVHPEGSTAPIAVDMAQLERASLDTRGAFYWQYLLVDPETVEGRAYIKVSLEKSLATLDRLFPDWDDGRYADSRTRWAKIKGARGYLG